MLIFGAFFSALVGCIIFLIGLYPFWMLSGVKKRVIKISIDGKRGEVGERRYIGRFAWVKYVVNFEYSYKINNVAHQSRQIYFSGEDEFEENKAANGALENLLGQDFAFIDPKKPSVAFLVLKISDKKRNGSIGLMSSGFVLMVVSLIFLFANYLV